MKVCLGGTFNVLHKGHRALIDTAIQTAGKNGMVFIGVTKGKIAQKKKSGVSFSKRVKTLKKYLERKGYEKHAVILPLFDKYGPAVYGDYDAIIVSPESCQNAVEINLKRKNVGKKPLKIIQIPFVLAEDRKPISATRILEGKIDANGKIAGKTSRF